MTPVLASAHWCARNKGPYEKLKRPVLKGEWASDRSQMQIMQGGFRKGRCLRLLPGSLSPRQHEFCFPGNSVFSAGAFKFCLLAFPAPHSDFFCLGLSIRKLLGPFQGSVPGRWHYPVAWAMRGVVGKISTHISLGGRGESGRVCDLNQLFPPRPWVHLSEENDCVPFTLINERAKEDLPKQKKVHFKCLRRSRHKAVLPSNVKNPTQQWTHLPVSREKKKQTSRESIFPNKSKKEKVIMKQKQKDILKPAKNTERIFFFPFW